MGEIRHDISQQGAWTVFGLEGQLDRTTAEETGSRLSEVWKTSSQLAVELSGLEYISSAGIRIIIRLAKQAKAEGKAFCICGAAGFVKEVVEDANLDLLVDMCPSAEALP